MNNKQLGFYIAFFIIVMSLVGWVLFKWYTIPCNEFKHSMFKNSYAPARCLP